MISYNTIWHLPCLTKSALVQLSTLTHHIHQPSWISFYGFSSAASKSASPPCEAIMSTPLTKEAHRLIGRRYSYCPNYSHSKLISYNPRLSPRTFSMKHAFTTELPLSKPWKHPSRNLTPFGWVCLCIRASVAPRQTPVDPWLASRRRLVCSHFYYGFSGMSDFVGGRVGGYGKVSEQIKSPKTFENPGWIWKGSVYATGM